MKRLNRMVRGAAAFVAVAACTHTIPPAASTATRAVRPAVHGRGYELVMQATSCWMGGLWSDALGEKGQERFDGIAHRCDELLRSVVAPSDEYFPLRAVEPRIVDVLAKEVQQTAERDSVDAPQALELAMLMRRIADAMRETTEARRAADVVKENVAEQPQVEVRNADKAAAAAKLQTSGALDALFRGDSGPFAEEAHAVAMLVAIDRMEIARGLPKHLKVYAVDTAYRDVFGVSPPAVPAYAAAPLPTGRWLAYLSDVAAAAHHPVPSDAHDPQNREPLAWTGVLEGFADRLRAEAPRLPTGAPLRDVERAIIARLDEEFRNEHDAYEAHAPQDR